MTWSAEAMRLGAFGGMMAALAIVGLASYRLHVLEGRTPGRPPRPTWRIRGPSDEAEEVAYVEPMWGFGRAEALRQEALWNFRFFFAGRRDQLSHPGSHRWLWVDRVAVAAAIACFVANRTI